MGSENERIHVDEERGIARVLIETDSGEAYCLHVRTAERIKETLAAMSANGTR